MRPIFAGPPRPNQERLDGFKNGVNETDPLLLDVAQEVARHRREIVADQDMRTERRQRAGVERLDARLKLPQGFRGGVEPLQDAEAGPLEQVARALRRHREN